MALLLRCAIEVGKKGGNLHKYGASTYVGNDFRNQKA